MKVTVNNTDNNTSKPFPKLMIDKDGVIYFFTQERCGVPIANWFPDKWASYDKLDLHQWNEMYTDFNGSITLSND